jgi:hypothetical protein
MRSGISWRKIKTESLFAAANGTGLIDSVALQLATAAFGTVAAVRADENRSTNRESNRGGSARA